MEDIRDLEILNKMPMSTSKEEFAEQMIMAFGSLLLHK